MYCKVAASALFIAFACRREILARRASDNHVWLKLVDDYCTGLYVTQVHLFCWMTEVTTIYVKCSLPLVVCGNNVEPCFLKAETQTSTTTE